MSEIITGDALATLRTLPSESVQCIVTSPPYYSLRDYGVAGQIGLEDTPAEYVTNLVTVFREARRVLRSDGTCWINLGDSYSNEKKWGGQTSGKHVDAVKGTFPRAKRYTGLGAKNLMMIPARVAIALQEDGWILRSDIIWHKPNVMPESVEDRPTSAHEHLFLLAKSEQYFYDNDAIREPTQDIGFKKKTSTRLPSLVGDHGTRGQDGNGMRMETVYNNPLGRNKRNVWTIASQSYSGAHFATFPPKLVEPCILAGTSPRACEYCSAPWQRVTVSTGHINTRESAHVPYNTPTKTDSTGWAPTRQGTNDWQPTCTCENEGTGKCVVLDPFMGAGTVALVSIRLQRHYLGIELNPQYVELIHRRIAEVQPVLWEVAG